MAQLLESTVTSLSLSLSLADERLGSTRLDSTDLLAFASIIGGGRALFSSIRFDSFIRSLL
jgi:hypothetical protein